MPAGYVVPSALNGLVIQCTSSPARSSRFTAIYALFTRRSVTKPAAPRAFVTRPGGGVTFQSSTRSNGPVNPSRIRSNCTPIWYANVQPAWSYGAVGGAPGYGNTSGCTCGSNMSITCGRNDCAVNTTYEPAG